MKTFYIIFIWGCSFGICFAQPDTVLIKQKIDALQTPEAKKIFLNELLTIDQSSRGEDVKVSQDIDNLVAIAYYLNSYGLPEKSVYGDAYRIFPIIFVHTSYDALSKLVFPLVRIPFQSKYISETQLRTYYLRPMYERQFENEDYKTIPLDKLYSELTLNTSDHIHIPTLVSTINEIIAFKKAKKTEIMKFKAPFHEKEVNVNGNKVMIAIKTSPAQIFTLEDGRIFFHKISIDRPYEPQELTQIEEKKFKFKDQKSYNYFEIDAEGSLIYRRPAEIIDVYKRDQ
ncbi:MAG: hypothetical protein M3R25_10110 [Bacteroidota bacterium]|nr:hypothetical protein [Bacteroidota bacterium]